MNSRKNPAPYKIATQPEAARQRTNSQPRQSSAAQPKLLKAPQVRPPAAAPLFNRQPGVQKTSVQLMKAGARPDVAKAKPTQPTAPPVYRPQPPPKVLQRKTQSGRPAADDVLRRGVIGAPRPQTPGPANRTPAAPPVYQPQPQPKLLQTKAARPGAGANNPNRPAQVGHSRPPLPAQTPAQRTPQSRGSVQRSVSPQAARPGAGLQGKGAFRTGTIQRVVTFKLGNDGWIAGENNQNPVGKYISKTGQETDFDWDKWEKDEQYYLSVVADAGLEDEEDDYYYDEELSDSDNEGYAKSKKQVRKEDKAEIGTIKRSGKKNQRDKWYGSFANNPDAQAWYHRHGKNQFNQGNDITDANQALILFQHYLNSKK